MNLYILTGINILILVCNYILFELNNKRNNLIGKYFEDFVIKRNQINE